MEMLDPKPVKLADDDKHRMARLYEEIEGRLEEMALIASRTVGLAIGKDAVTQFQREATEGEGPGGVDIEIVCTPEGCICYDYREGTCSVC